MTYRQQLDRRVRVMNITNYSMLAVIMLSLTIGIYAEKALGSGIVICSVIVICLVALIFIVRALIRLRCPSCNASLSYILGATTGFKVPSHIQHCPKCGISFDRSSEDLK
jgi:hypothetical protein